MDRRFLRGRGHEYAGAIVCCSRHIDCRRPKRPRRSRQVAAPPLWYSGPDARCRRVRTMPRRRGFTQRIVQRLCRDVLFTLPAVVFDETMRYLDVEDRLGAVVDGRRSTSRTPTVSGSSGLNENDWRRAKPATCARVATRNAHAVIADGPRRHRDRRAVISAAANRGDEWVRWVFISVIARRRIGIVFNEIEAQVRIHRQSP